MPEENKLTTMQISRENLEKIGKLKEHPKIPNDEIVKRLLNFWDRYEGVVEDRKKPAKANVAER